MMNLKNDSVQIMKVNSILKAQDFQAPKGHLVKSINRD